MNILPRSSSSASISSIRSSTPVTPSSQPILSSSSAAQQPVPAIPTSATLIADSTSNKFNISWGNVGAYKYVLEYSASDSVDSLGSSWLPSSVVSGSTSVSINRSAVAAVNFYVWRIKACNSVDQCSGWINTRNATFHQPITPSTTSLISPSNGSSVSTLPCFNWQPDSTAASITVTVSPISDFPDKRWAIDLGAGASQVCFHSGWYAGGANKYEMGAANLVTGQTYYWRVVSVFPGNKYGFTETRSFTVSNSPGAPTLDAKVINNSYWQLEWNKPDSSVTRYELTETANGQTKVLSVSGNTYVPTVTGSATYKVVACNSNGCGATQSNTRTLNIEPTPQASSVTASTDVYSQHFSLTIGASTGAAKYELEYNGSSTDTGFSSANWKSVSKDSTLSRTISMASVKDYAYVLWRVRACNTADICSGWVESRIKANQYDALSTSAILISPASGALIEKANGAPCFEWQVDPAAQQYAVTISDSTEFTDKRWINTVSGTRACWDAGWGTAGIYRNELPVQLSPSTTYYWRVVSIAGGGRYGFSPIRTFSISPFPAAPILDAKFINNNYWQLEWNKPDASVTGYELSETINGTTVKKSLANVNSYQPAVLGSVSYEIAACNANGCGSASNIKSITIEPAPDAPSISVSTDVYSQTFSLSWVNVGAAKYELQFKGASSQDGLASAGWQPVSKDASISKTITMGSLQAYSYLLWQVRSCNSADNCSAWQLSRIKTNQFNPLPGSANLVAPANGAVVSNTVGAPCFEWQADASAAHYVVTVSNTTEFTEKRWAITVIADTKVCWNNGWAKAGPYANELSNQLSFAEPYYWRVVSVSYDGRYGFSPIRSFSMSSTPGVPTLTAKLTDDKTGWLLQWVKPIGNVFKYELEEDNVNESGGRWIEHRVPLATDVTYLSKVMGETKYKIRACNAQNECSAYSNTVITLLETVPAAPAQFAAVQNLELQRFDLSWQPVNRTTGYKIQYSVSDSAEEAKLSTSWIPLIETDQLNISFTDAVIYKHYKWRVAACKKSGVCSEWVETPVKVLQPKPTLISPLLLGPSNAAQTYINSINHPCFRWTLTTEEEARKISKYVVTVSTTPDFSDRRWSIDIGVSSGQSVCWSNGTGWERKGTYAELLPNGLEIGGTYYWRVVAVNGGGELGFSETRSFTLTDNASGAESAAQVVNHFYEAETAELFGVVKASENEGFSGAGFGDYNSAVGSYIEWTHVSQAATQAVLSVRYSNGNAPARPMNLFVNGVLVSQNNFQTTSSWKKWVSVHFSVPLNAGSNKIKLVATTANGGPNVDYIDVATGAIVSPAEISVPTPSLVSSSDGKGLILNWTASTGAVDYYQVFASEPLGTTYSIKNTSFNIPSVYSATYKIRGCRVTGTCGVYSEPIFISNSIYEAEVATGKVNVQIVNTIPGYYGTGFASFNAGGHLEWNVYRTASEQGVLLFSYLNTGASALTVPVNKNGVSIGSVSLAPTNGAVWKTVGLPINLALGNNYVKFAPTGDASGIYIDRLVTQTRTVNSPGVPSNAVPEISNVIFNLTSDSNGDIHVSWSGARSYADLYEKVGNSLNWLKKGEGAGNYSYIAKNKQAGKYTFVLKECYQSAAAANCLEFERAINIGNGSSGGSVSAGSSSSISANLSPYLVGPDVNSPPPEGLPEGAVVGSTSGQFRVSESGAATYSVPLELPDGVAGVAPQLSFDYSSMSGNGLLGQGWSLSGLSAITRCRQTLVQDNQSLPIRWSGDDRFCFDGQRLMLVSGVYGASDSEYRTEIDSGVYVTAKGGSIGHPDYFEVRAKDGSISYFGFTNDSKLTGVAANTTLTWSINRFQDNVGNGIDFIYSTASGGGQYIDEIRYAFPSVNTEQPSASRTDFNAKVRFNYVDRKDKTEAFIAGQKFVQAKKLDSVSVFNADSSTGFAVQKLVKHYRLKYMGDATADARYENTLTRLTQIFECRAETENVTDGSCLAPLSFTWGGGSHVAFDKAMTSLAFPTVEEGRYLLNHQFADVNGDGKQDLIYLTIEKLFDETTADVNINIAYADSNKNGLNNQTTINLYRRPYENLRIAALDYNADGRQDLALYTGEYWRVYLSTVNASSGWYLDGGGEVENLQEFTDPDMLFMDVNGDGLADAVTSTGYYKLQRNSNSVGSSRAYSFANQINSFQWRPRSEFTQVNEPLPTNATNFSDCHETAAQTKIQQDTAADFNGDGVMDFLGSYVRKLSCSTSAGPTSIDATYRYALVNLGGVLQIYSGAALQTPSILPGGSTDRLFVVDVNGDGLTDVVSLGYDKKLVIKMSNGLGFNAAQEWITLSGLDGSASPQFMDYNGDGIVDVIWRDLNEGKMKVQYGGLSSLPQAIFNTSVDKKESYLLADVSGDGVADYVHVDSDSLSGRLGQMAVKGQPACYIQYHQGGSTEVCPDPSYALMEEQQHNFIYKIENGFGNATLIAYGTLSNSGRYATMDVKPETVSRTYSNNCPSNAPIHCSPSNTYDELDSSSFYRRLNSGWELPAGHRVFDPTTETFVNASGLPSKGNPVLEVNGAMQVVTSVKSSAPLPTDGNAMSRIDYYYAEAKLQAMGRGFLGFGRLKTVDAQTKVATVTTYRQDFPFSGSPLTTTVYKDDTAGSPILSYAVNQWDSRLLKNQGTRVFQPYLKQSQEFTYVLDSDGNVSALPLQKITTDTAMYPFDSDTADSLGNVREVVVTTEGSGKTLIKKTINQYSSDSWALRMGRLKRSEVETTLHGETNKRVAEFKYYGVDGEDVSGGARGLLKEEKVISEKASDQLVTEYTYDGRGNKNSVKVRGLVDGGNVQERTTAHNYDTLGRYLVSSVNGASHQSVISGYDEYGQPHQITDANNISTEVKYDSFGNEYLRKEVFAGGQTGAWTRKDTLYCDSGSACPVGAKFFTRQRVSGGGETIAYFDILGRSIRAGKKGFDGIWIYTDSEYDNLGRIKRQSMPYFSNSSPVGWTENFYDSLGRIVRIEAPDESGTIKTETAYSWDSTTGALLTTITNPKGQVRKEHHNGLGQLIHVEDQLKGTIVYEYSPLGEILSVTTDAPDVNEATIKMCYDKQGRKSGMFDPDKGGFNGTSASCSQINNWAGGSSNITAGWWHYRYNAFGELIEQRDPSGQSTQMRYDNLGRMVNRLDYKTDTHLEANTAWFFDKPLGASAEQDKTRGKLTAVVMSNSTSAILNNDGACTGANHCSIYTYNGRAQVSSTTTRLETGDVFITQSDYDSIGRLYQVRDVLDQVGGIFGFESGVQTHFNENGYAYRSVDIASWDGTDGVLSTITNMNQNGQVTREIRGNGLTTVNEYYPKSGLLKSQRVTDAVGLKIVQSIDYQWDSLGNLTSRTNKSAQVLKEGQTLQANNRAEGFCYDALNRLVKSLATSNPVCSGEAGAGDDITYDGFGNIKNKKGVGDYSYNRTNGGPHAVTKAGTASYFYDSNGNMVAESGSTSDLGNRTIEYTSYDMVETIYRGNDRSVEFKYGPDRSRWQRKDRNGTSYTTTTYLGNVERIEKVGVPEVEWRRNVAGVTITYKTTADADKQNLKIHNANKSYVYSDHLGSVDIITNTLGVATQSMSFDPWGARRPADSNSLAAWGEGTTKTDSQVLGEILASLTLTGFANPITTRGYTGHEMIDDMGIIHMNGRIYDPRLARFLQADPFIQAATNTQSYNRYSYVLNNPLNATDPSGFFFKKIYNALKDIRRSIIRGAIKVFGAEVVGFVGAAGSIFCGPYAAVCAAAWAYDFARAVGASSSQAFNAAAVAAVMTYVNGPPKLNIGSAISLAAERIDPNLGKAINFINNGVDWNSTVNSFINLAHEVKNYYVSRELERVANKNGLSLAELNALLTVNSFIGNKVAGGRYDEKTNSVSGFTSREKGLVGVIWDVNDTILGYQGLLDASGHEYITSNNVGKAISGCHSLGTLTCNNLVARGYAPSAQLNSLPFGNIAVSTNMAITNLGKGDFVNGFLLGRIFNPFSTSTDCLDSSLGGALCHGWKQNYQNHPENRRKWL
ncbi:RHS repeat-associated core domain-containing protein [Cellvibrio sp. KY-GH-1]|uniref:RHS repeat-associated core domain-containing protein n=1 Tax=Cellvibrio sp. KY-GH-1 TaxID=2303332 RepID=UPI00177C4354|nr:RHS repeat-associated core domain-containing protein [Cellvibrio sp. KY-GH-1]